MAGPTDSGPVCISTHSPTPTVLQLEAGSRGRSPECFLTAMGQARGEGVCQPPMEPGGKNSVPGMSSDSNHHVSSVSMEDTGVALLEMLTCLNVINFTVAPISIGVDKIVVRETHDSSGSTHKYKVDLPVMLKHPDMLIQKTTPTVAPEVELQLAA